LGFPEFLGEKNPSLLLSRKDYPLGNGLSFFPERGGHMIIARICRSQFLVLQIKKQMITLKMTSYESSHAA
jgi:hypothetical protein